MEEYKQRAEKIAARINELAAISEDETGITRTFGTKAFIQGRDKVQNWMRQAGLKTTIDNIGNLRGKLYSDKAGAKTFVIASHIDTVVNAGKWDGPLGVIMGLDLLEKLQQTKDNVPFNVELIAFSDEEGVRYHTTYLGSKVVAGSFNMALLDKPDAQGIKLREAIEKISGDVTLLQQDFISPQEWLGYFEIHIEQGPVLYEKNISAAIVTAIAGQRRIEITFKGMAGHAGTVPMHMRNDALCAAAEFIVETEKYAIKNKDKIVATVGKLHIINAASNVIPGEVVCTLDVRSADESVLTLASETLQSVCTAIATNRKVVADWNLVQHTGSITCNTEFNALLSRSIEEADSEVIFLVSGAGHDAVPVAQVAPVAMLFVRCFKGISHNPLEDVELKDIEASLRISDNFIKNLILKHNS